MQISFNSSLYSILGRLSVFLIIFATFFTNVSSSHSQGIRIIDCQGRTKALRQNPTEAVSTMNAVQVAVINSQGQRANNVSLKLINAKGEFLEATSIDGLAQFPQVDQGLWMLSAENPGFFFTSISLSDPIVAPFWNRAQDLLVQAGKVVLVGAALVGAAVIVDQASSGNGGGSDTVNPPPAMDCPACNPDQAAPSIPPFQ